MQVESATTPTLTRQQRRDAAGEEVQNLFNEILTQAGQSGYASAEAYESENSVETDIQQTWDDWFTVSNAGNYPDGVSSQDLKTGYGQILVRAYNEGGYLDPKGFLSGLSDEDLEIIQHVSRLVDPINPNAITDEGALNLLIPMPAQVDANNDGLTQVGKGNSIRFPDSRTPEAVVNAWNETTADMPPAEKMMYELRMKLSVITANIIVDDNGQFVRQREPGDADWVNPMAADNYSYQDLAQQYLDYLDYFKNQIPPDQYEKDTAFWTDFKQTLAKHGAQ
ncbi:hypothetical protein DTL21_27265 [Bremerella cremea]|uniref:Uncharacterized protein n=1 Tax=Blastopirellula marina TaxID=124 RepID=A0A2S8FC59_9BACT|nr:MULTISPECIES: hypothetical protein [Pirellulaceae]PQO29737.1 hypothetical protein C5Y83_27220 [Blastopirellula marina]RCS43039.1 hypothetical protein DTL21_27265 [Bremerella cremea]